MELNIPFCRVQTYHSNWYVYVLSNAENEKSRSIQLLLIHPTSINQTKIVNNRAWVIHTAPSVSDMVCSTLCIGLFFHGESKSGLRFD